ncbi:AhpD family alkylhydroperoxidase [Psychromicrobium silvestre]|uniref:AhpD family alkylhydroperoxidase n=1 Tax=Psychromicrobium silvestre TaxID=1645614 RepID=A0A7Y9LQS0_9MICC|nr:carboxymuconolactone decarboxylase family protein [Psychromicrobium silvestre]NYE93886.1 AhpD family alkylhydroperoxidase [Psychromicrobium silvestre]
MTRLPIHQHAPEGYKAVAALDQYVTKNIDHVLLDLVKLRASQLNGCAFCVDMHATDLEKTGVPSRKIFAVSAWRETDFFSDRERAALALTEQVTFISSGVDEKTWQEAARLFSERELSDLILAIGTINLWNRIGVSTHLAPPALG